MEPSDLTATATPRRHPLEWSRCLLLALLAVCHASCAVDSDTTALQVYRAPERPVSAAAQSWAVARCAWLERCQPEAVHMLPGSTWEACADALECTTRRDEVTAAVYAGTSLAEQAAAWESTPCGDTRVHATMLRPPTNFLQGPAPEVVEESSLLVEQVAPAVGQLCYDLRNEEPSCEPGAFCEPFRPQSLNPHSCGVCRVQVEIGGQCTSRRECVLGADCISSQCMEQHLEGEECVSDIQCWSRSCVQGLCRSAFFDANRDLYAPALGRACQTHDDCGADYLRCLNGSCSPGPDHGDPCDATSDCRLGQFCIDGACMTLGCTLDLGERCEGADVLCEQSECVDGVCRAFSDAVGDPCILACAPGLVCVQQECRTGAPVESSRGIGTECRRNRDCSSGYCDCQQVVDCGDGSCGLPACITSGSCAPAPEPERLCER